MGVMTSLVGVGDADGLESGDKRSSCSISSMRALSGPLAGAAATLGLFDSSDAGAGAGADWFVAGNGLGSRTGSTSCGEAGNGSNGDGSFSRGSGGFRSECSGGFLGESLGRCDFKESFFFLSGS